MIVEQYTLMKEELSKIRTEIDYKTQKQNQCLISQVTVLKKDILELEKSKEKLEHDYERKLLHIIKVN